MAHTEFTVPLSGSDNESWRDWGGRISQALDDVGLTLAESTINWTTVSRPVNSGTDAGYEVWEFPAPPSGGCPLFLRVRYGTAASSTYFRMRVETGSGWAGSGVLTGVGSSVTHTIGGDGTDATYRECWMSSDGDGLAFVYCPASSQAAARAVLLIDRQRNDAGTAEPRADHPNTGYLRHVATGGGSSAGMVGDPVANATGLWSSRYPAIPPGVLTTTTSLLSETGKMRMLPTIIANRQGEYWGKMALAYPIFDQVGDDLINVDHLGATRTYRTVGSAVAGFTADASPGAGVAIWWEDTP